MLSYFIHVQYCYIYLVNQIPMGLLLYAHIPTGLMALLFGTYVLVKTRNLTGVLFFSICTSFFFWCLFDLSAWFAFLGSANTMFTWSFLDFLAVLMFFFSYYFLYVFITKQDLPSWQKALALMIMLPTAIITLLGLNLPYYDSNVCAAIENESLTRYAYYAEALFILASTFLTIFQYRRSKERFLKNEILLAGTGVLIFLLFFFSATLLVSLLAGGDASLYVYNYLIYGLFGMPIFLAYFGYLIVRYHIFNLKVFGAQALVTALLVLIASELVFVSSDTTRILVAVTLALTAVGGLTLIRSVRREIEQRELIEEQEKALQVANKQQENLLHFISHEIKGYLTKSEAGFAAISEGDYGAIPAPLKQMANAALLDVRKGVRTVMDILDASNLKKGTVSYDKKQFDFKQAVVDLANELKPGAEEKHLSLDLRVAEGNYMIDGDEEKIRRHVIRNIIDNSIKYTPQGKVSVDLSHEGNTLRLIVSDTGVGITPEDMQRLFTEGGHGKDSIKVNVHSTGYGLYIAKQVAEAHGGKIWAESDGAGKGSRFIIELPAV